MSRKARKDGQYYLTTALDDDSRIMSILTNYMDRGDEDRKLNPKEDCLLQHHHHGRGRRSRPVF